MKKLYVAVLSSVLAVPAYAGGLVEPVVEQPVIAPQPIAPIVSARDWTGGYVGGQLGFGEVSGETGGTAPVDLDGNGGVGGIHAGYLFDFGGWALGPELSYNRTNIDIDTDATPAVAFGELDDIVALKLRAGPTFGDVFAYGTLGVASARVTLDGADDARDNGWVAGIGAEYMMSDQWSLGGEILHHRFDDFDDVDGTDLRATTAQARVSFRF